MAGLGLMNAIGMWERGTQARRERDQYAEQKARDDKVKAANQAAVDYLADAEKAHQAEQAAALDEWTRTKGSGEGFQAKPFKADDAVMFRAAAARGDALARAGLLDEYVKNRAAIMPMQMQARQAAWQRFQTDGDHGALGASMYDTIPDGKRVKAYDVADAPGPDGKSAGKKIRFQLDDGTVKFFKPEDVERMAKLAATDPGKVIENELARDLWQFKQETEGKEKRATETHKHNLGLAEIAAKHANELGIVDLQNKSAERRTATSAAATRYSADKGLEGVKIRAAAEKPTDRVKRFDAIHDQVKNIAGKVAGGPFGSTRMADEDTLNIARYAEALMESDESMDAGAAINASIAEFKKRKPAGK